MNNIILNHTITASNIKVEFNLNNGDVPPPPVNIDLNGDVDFNQLINELIKLIELKRKLSVEFLDSSKLSETNDKIKLIKETVGEIYSCFNEKMTGSLEVGEDML